ncbi:MAG: permease [Acidobacteria bacterium]|nr:permease [Acidobacteriota bacterium]
METIRLSLNSFYKFTGSFFYVPNWLKTALAAIIWYVVYKNLNVISKWLTYDLLGFTLGSHLGSAIEFFIFEVPKVLMLLIIVVYGVGVVRTFFTPERTRNLLAGKRESLGNILAAMLGIVTPFCSCSAVPLFIGFIKSGVPIGVTFSFLIAAPMINEVAIVLLFSLFGIKVTAIYVFTGLSIAILTGWIIGHLHMEKYIEDWVNEVEAPLESDSSLLINWQDRLQAGRDAVKEIVKKVWFYIVLGIAVGAGIHGYVPTGMMAGILGKNSWWSVPLAVLIGVPMYSNAAGIVPIAQALLEKGASLGSVLAFMMSVIGLSLPEIIILRNVLKMPLILTFVGVLTIGIILVGYLFNLIF